MASVVNQILEAGETNQTYAGVPTKIGQQFSVTVGDPQFCVDLMLINNSKRASHRRAIGLVDLCAFEANGGAAEDIADYYFQLQRATPAIRPVFLFLHELADSRSQAFKRLLRALTKANAREDSQEAA